MEDAVRAILRHNLAHEFKILLSIRAERTRGLVSVVHIFVLDVGARLDTLHPDRLAAGYYMATILRLEQRPVNTRKTWCKTQFPFSAVWRSMSSMLSPFSRPRSNIALGSGQSTVYRLDVSSPVVSLHEMMDLLCFDKVLQERGVISDYDAKPDVLKVAV